MFLESEAFANNSIIPQKYACDGQNINPPFKFGEIPPGTKSLVFIMEDPDVPKHFKPDGMFDHWVIWNLSPLTREIEENSTPEANIGMNSAGSLNYTGPCPPDREHRYFFYLYALDSKLSIDPKSQKKDVLAAMEGHVISKAELMGRYERK